ncbi:NAD+ diphosphatase [Powellomyces hirtus]|uniref:NAD(+) diphosphatase n=1 Tax=Powellomyces hirtus TaxID=109895 RepID=A0A507DW23_9FUNG|nr:NAD+ diphosphatase [Powellomyces hirtus]
MSRFTHLFAGGSLNRLSVLRSNPGFIASSTQSPHTRYLALRNLDPLLTAAARGQSIAWLSYADVKDALSAGAFHVFLGVDESDAGTDEFTSERKGGVVVIKGRSYWAIDLTKGAVYDSVLDKTDKEFESKNYSFAPMRGALSSLPWEEESAILAQGRSVIDWNVRNQFCPACGKKTESGEAGYKRFCPRPAPGEATDGAEADKTARCLSLTGVNNFQYPRTDPVVIIAVTHPTDPNKILLGRQARFPPEMFTCVAGFMEPGETIEEACRREVHEETGIKVGQVAYHSSQPWPFPNSVMIGCIGQGVSTEVNLIDEELEDARWFTREQARAAIAVHHDQNAKNDAPDAIKVPPPYAIAHQLVKAWLEGFGPVPSKM